MAGLTLGQAAAGNLRISSASHPWRQSAQCREVKETCKLLLAPAWGMDSETQLVLTRFGRRPLRPAWTKMSEKPSRRLQASVVDSSIGLLLKVTANPELTLQVMNANLHRNTKPNGGLKII